LGPGLAPGITGTVDPAVLVTSPAPGSWLAGPDVPISGRARVPGRTIVSVDVDGQAAVVSADGTFQGVAHLPSPGLSTVSVHAVDSLGADWFRHVSYVRGPFQTGEVTDALVVRLEPSALAPGSALVNQELTAIDLDATLRGLGPLKLASVGQLVTIDLTFLKTTYGTPTATLAFGQGTLDVDVVFPNLSVTGVVDDRSGLIPLSVTATLTATSARASGQATLAITPAGVTCAINSPVAVVDGLTIQAPGLAGFVANLAKKQVHDLIVSELEKLLATKVPGMIDKALANATGAHPFTLGQGTVQLALRPVSVDLSPNGFALALAAEASPLASGSTQWPARGSVPATLGPTTCDARVAISQDFLESALVALWSAGSLDVDFQLGGPGAGSSLALDASSLGKLVPELTGAVPAGTPLVARIRPRCPPELRVGAGVAPLVLAIGEVEVELLANEQGALRSLLTVSVHGEIPVDVVTTPSLGIAPAPTRASFLFSIVQQPVRIDEERLAVRLSLLADALLPRAFTALASIPLPVLLGHPLVDPSVSISQPGFDHLVLGASLR
jgi:hypothetical protein